MNPLLFLVLLAGLLKIQQANAQCKIIYRSQDLTVRTDQDLVARPDTGNHITSIESRGILSKYLVVHYEHTKRALIPKKEIWGYIDSQKTAWRSYQKELFRVIKYNEGWVEYVINRPVGTRLTPTYNAVMYSRTLDSPIRTNWSQAMADVPLGHIIR
ncbi:hypothetical protein GO755_18690 [Spirosoma sp. HMF4905]|uniref:GLPGLI family protein n=1 Tax=Spirosoma arboris TaxID=2682092 RepID=A0A7K1SEB9_9BACT|nr:hypothetical protein [Spirosoma arboris]MVM32084.1 hypothetical protein [Spirosoma arboris]